MLNIILILGLALLITIVILLVILLLRKPHEPPIEAILHKTMPDMLHYLAREQSLYEFTNITSEGLDRVRNKLDERLDKIQAQNERKLEEMRQTVSEKLDKTLESRLKQSFQTVSAQLESVNRGLGEMKSVAESVGSLNQVLAGTKSRGALGELQLGQIIEDMLPSTLYQKEATIKKGSSERVDYVIKLPGTEAGQHVLLPIDSKFPLDDYYRLLDAYEAGNAAQVANARKSLHNRIKDFAKSVRSKYISPPETTAFAVIFLPAEGLYAEIARDGDLFNELRRGDITITGPTTLSAMLNALQIGFKTLQIQQNATSIGETLGAVKKEFETFEGTLNKAHRQITDAGKNIETLVGTRTRAINRKLKNIQTYTGEDKFIED